MRNDRDDVDNLNDFKLPNDYFDYEEVPSLKKELLE